MKNVFFAMLTLMLFEASCSLKKDDSSSSVSNEGNVRLITLDPGHFHAALVQKSSYPQVSNDVYVYAPAGNDLEEHLKKVEAYNTRDVSPTNWNEIIYTGTNFLEKMIEEKKGNVMIVAGNNKKKIGYIKQAIQAGINVLADKPLIINASDFELLRECFELANQNGILLYDIMTERHEITTILQRELSLIPAIYGTQLHGTPEDPAIVKESVHHFCKIVSDKPLIRPAWFFDVEQQGEGIVDVSTHLIDMIQWEAFPDVIIDYHKDIELLDANRWPTPMSLNQFKAVTDMDHYPGYLQKNVKGDSLHIYANGDILYKIKGIHAKVLVKWDYSYPEGGGDTHFSVMKGSKSNLVIRQDKEQNYLPELYIESTGDIESPKFEEMLSEAFKLIGDTYPDVSFKKINDRVWQVVIPSKYRVGHEAHFGQVTENYLRYLSEGVLPDWEVPNMISKYYLSTKALELAKDKK